MSRKGVIQGVRRTSDYYPTPPWVTRSLLQAIKPEVEARFGMAPVILEPAAGKGHIVRELRAVWPAAKIMAWDLGYSQILMPNYEVKSEGGDSLARDWGLVGLAPDLVVMNPPFTLCEAFVEKAFESGIPLIACLQRVAWLTPAENRLWLRTSTPSLLALAHRPSFAHKCWRRLPAKGQRPQPGDFELVPFDEPSPAWCVKREAATDASEYAWFVWGLQSGARVEILPRVPLAERREGSWEAPHPVVSEASCAG